MPSTVLHALTMNIVAKNASPTILRISVSPDPKGTDALCDQKARHDENRSIMPTELSVARSMRRDAILAGVSMQFGLGHGYRGRSEEHTSELQSLMRISYAVFCLKKKKTKREGKI